MSMVLTAVSCANAGEKIPEQEAHDLSDIIEQRDFYLSETAHVRDKHGFVPGCDGLLFTSLSIVGGFKADLYAAYEDGKWYRTPTKDCYSDGRSKSECSKDGFIGLLWSLYYTGDLRGSEKLISYGRSRNWIMCEGGYSRVWFSFQLRKTLADIVYRLGGKNHYTMRAYPVYWAKGLKGFEAHIQTIHILLRSKVNNKITKSAIDRVKEHYSRNPRNAFFVFAYHYFVDGDHKETILSLKDEDLFPRDRLPTSQDRCEEYIWQRELGHNWEPCPDEEETYTATDYLFVAKLLEEALEE